MSHAVTESGDNVFFTADHHFGHENIIKYCSRPFVDLYYMNQKMIWNWNDVVPKDGVVYHLGDFCLGDIDEALKYMTHLNGKKYFLSVPWHHDRRWIPDFMDRASVLPVFFLGPEAVIQVEGQFIHLSHYPLGEWDRKHYGAWHIHGHSHGKYKGDCHRTGERCIDAGVDSWHFYPASFGQIRDTIAIYQDDGNFHTMEGE